MELIKVENHIVLASEELVNKVLEVKLLEDKLKAKKDDLTLTLMEEMRNKDIKKIETPDVIITYVEESERETFDSKQFREDYPDMYDEYIKFTKVKPSVRIKVK